MDVRPYDPPREGDDTLEFLRTWTLDDDLADPGELTAPLPRIVPEPRHTARVVALVPARNEGESIGAAVQALHAQTHPFDRIVVVTNNCTDDGLTARLASQAGAEVITMENNPHLKAGALNHALDVILPDLDDDDFVLIQDADTELNVEFVRTALAALREDTGGVCARYDAAAPSNLLERLQANEFTRSRRQITRDRGKVRILVGIATLFRVRVLRTVIDARKTGILPGSPTLYNLTSLCEDYRLTLDLRLLGYTLTSPADCRPKTHAMHTVPKLWGQRVRWTRGALDDLRELGWSRITAPYILAQYRRLLAMISPFLYVAYLLSLEITFGRIVWELPWLAVNAIVALERTVTVRKGGWKAMLIAALILPEVAYDWFLAATYLTGLVQHLRSTPHQWKET
jgi:poly-beta-1,6-N-acetyl-D-glucosamine synthase